MACINIYKALFHIFRMGKEKRVKSNWVLIVSVIVIIAVVAGIYIIGGGNYKFGPDNGKTSVCQGTGDYSKESCSYDPDTQDCLHNDAGKPGCVNKCIAPSGKTRTTCDGKGKYGDKRVCCPVDGLGWECDYRGLEGYPGCKALCPTSDVKACFSKDGRDYSCCKPENCVNNKCNA